MNGSEMYDVIVVGAGPGGAMAAKRCAEDGLKTLLIEKKPLPRDKVCSGMVMGRWAIDIIEREFGAIPETVLTDPPRLKGHRFYVGDDASHEFHWPTPFSWRRDLDFWMVQKAKASGVRIRDGVRVSRVQCDRDRCRVELGSLEKGVTVQGRFLIGADGATSVVRKSLFPKLNVRFSGPIREFYRGSLDLERDFFHWFFPRNLPRPRFNVNHKNGMFLIEGSGLGEIRNDILQSLVRYGFDPESRPIRKDACAIALLHGELLSGAFRPAQDNVLLVGDAAGVILPITFEGIGTALKTGLFAADAILRSCDDGSKAAAHYIRGLAPIIGVIQKLCSLQEKLKKDAARGTDFLAGALKDAYRETLLIQEYES